MHLIWRELSAAPERCSGCWGLAPLSPAARSSFCAQAGLASSVFASAVEMTRRSEDARHRNSAGVPAGLRHARARRCLLHLGLGARCASRYSARNPPWRSRRARRPGDHAWRLCRRKLVRRRQGRDHARRHPHFAADTVRTARPSPRATCRSSCAPPASSLPSSIAASISLPFLFRISICRPRSLRGPGKCRAGQGRGIRHQAVERTLGAAPAGTPVSRPKASLRVMELLSLPRRPRHEEPRGCRKQPTAPRGRAGSVQDWPQEPNGRKSCGLRRARHLGSEAMHKLIREIDLTEARNRRVTSRLRPGLSPG